MRKPPAAFTPKPKESQWALPLMIVIVFAAGLAFSTSLVLLIDARSEISSLSAALDNYMTQRAAQLNAIDQKLETRTDDRYRGSDAQKDFAKRDAQIKLLSKRIEWLERRTGAKPP